MARGSSSDTDSDVPETVNNRLANQSVAQGEKRLKAFDDAENRKRKEKRRAADEKLKQQKSEKIRRKKEEQAERNEEDVLARMEKAMREADSESEQEDAMEDPTSLEHAPSQLRKSKPSTLPDEVFEKAFAAAAASSRLRKRRPVEDTPPPAKKRKRVHEKSKDTIVGSRVMRRLEKPAIAHLSSVTMTAPPRKTRKFLTRTLGLSTGAAESKSKTSGWERRPANIGVLRGSGPATSFTRRKS